MKKFLEFLVRLVVNRPEKIQINEIAGERTVLLELRVWDGDIGKVIGRNGETARALRALLAAASAKTDKKFILEILTPYSNGPPKRLYMNSVKKISPQNPGADPGSKDGMRWQDDGGNNV